MTEVSVSLSVPHWLNLGNTALPDYSDCLKILNTLDLRLSFSHQWYEADLSFSLGPGNTALPDYSDCLKILNTLDLRLSFSHQWYEADRSFSLGPGNTAVGIKWKEIFYK